MMRPHDLRFLNARQDLLQGDILSYYNKHFLPVRIQRMVILLLLVLMAIPLSAYALPQSSNVVEKTRSCDVCYIQKVSVSEEMTAPPEGASVRISSGGGGFLIK